MAATLTTQKPLEYTVNGHPVDKPPRPSWMDRNPDEWPASAKRVYTILAMAAERKLAREAGN